MIVAPTRRPRPRRARHRCSRAVGTAGQRCTTLRRLIVHEQRLRRSCRGCKAAYASCRSAIRCEPATLVGPLIDARRLRGMQRGARRAHAPRAARSSAASASLADRLPDAYYVRPAIVRDARADRDRRARETFAPILYVMRYRDLDEAIALHNDVPQGLSSSIFTNDLREAELFLSADGSRLRHRQRQHRPSRRRDRRRFRRREGDRRRPRVGLRRLEGLHAPATNTINYSTRAARPGREVLDGLSRAELF